MTSVPHNKLTLRKKKLKPLPFHSIICRFCPRPIIRPSIFLCSLQCLWTVGGSGSTWREPTHTHTHHRENTQTPPSPICTLKNVLLCQNKSCRTKCAIQTSLYYVLFIHVLLFISHSSVYFSLPATHNIEFSSVPFFLQLTHSDGASLSSSVRSSRSRVGT